MSRRIASTLGLLACALTLAFAPASAPSAQTTDQFPPEQLEAMVTPYLDLPTPVLARIFNASKYPEAVAAAAGALQTPPTATVDATQLPPSVVGLIQSEPQLLMAMADDIEGTAMLGAAYQSQPGDVWIAVGAARTRASMLAAAEPEPDAGEAAESGAPPPTAEAPPPAAAAEAPPAAAPAPPPQAYAEPAYAAPTYYAPPPPNTVVVQEPTEAGYSGGTVAAAGVVGLGVGAVTGALLADDDDDDGDDYDIDIDEAYDNRRDLQEERQDYGDERYEQRTQDREEAYETRQGDREQAQATRQTTGQENQAARQSAAQQQQASHQASAQQRQVSRQGTQPSRQASAEQRQTSRQTVAQPSQGSRQASTARQGRGASRSSADSGDWGPFASSAGGSQRADRRRR